MNQQMFDWQIKPDGFSKFTPIDHIPNARKMVRFDGRTIDHERDTERLTKQLDGVRDLMLRGEWRTLAEIAEAVGAPESSVSARLRDLRKAKFGGYTVERRYVRRGLFEYRIAP